MSSEACPLCSTHPEIFGECDNEEKDLILHGARDLVLIEDASKIYMSVIQEYGVFEEILKDLSKKYNVAFLPSETFPFHICPKYESSYKGQANTKKWEDYYNLVKTYQKNNRKVINSMNPFITIIATDLGEEGGHYAALMRQNDGSIMLFDAMEYKGDESLVSSFYSPYFIQLTYDIFGVRPRIPDCMITSLQETGGFSGNIPNWLKVLGQRRRLSRETIGKLSHQTTESQNHFCFIWSIWWIHLKLSGRTMEEVMCYVNTYCINPLVIIKRYGWALFDYYHLERYIPCVYKKNKKTSDFLYCFYRKHFLSIWDLVDEKSLTFGRFRLSIPSCFEPLSPIKEYEIKREKTTTSF